MTMTLTYGDIVVESGVVTIYVLAPEAGETAGIIIDFNDSTCGGPWDDAYNSR